MTIVVEDGSKVIDANSYASEEDLIAYATARGITLTGDKEVLLIKAMDYIDSLNFLGIKSTKDQTLQWPRYDVWVDGFMINSNEIPKYLKNALLETAISIDQSVDPLQNVDRLTISETVGPISVTYKSGQDSTIVKRINAQLRKLLNGSWGGSFEVGRG